MQPRRWNAALAALLACAAAVPLAAGGQAGLFNTTTRIDLAGLGRAVPRPRIYAFGLSPDGRAVALLVFSLPPNELPTQLLIADAATGKILRNVATGKLAPYWGWSANFPPQVDFTPDGKWLVVQDQQRVRVFDANTLRPVATIEGPKGMLPVSICGARATDLFAVSFATHWRRNSDIDPLPVHVEMVAVPSERVEASWEANDIPQALSPDGSLAAVSDRDTTGRLVKLDVIDARSGKKIAVFDGGFKFQHPGFPEKALAGVPPPTAIGRAVGRFLTDKAIVLSPDDNVDRSGHHSGNSVRIVSIPDGHTVQELKPDEFGPTGGLAVSRDGALVLDNWYLKPSWYTHPHEVMPAGSAPELLVFSAKRPLHLTATIPVRGLTWPWAFRVAADGSVIAAEQDFGITVYSTATSASQQ